MKNRWISIFVVVVGLAHAGNLRAELITIFDTIDESVDDSTNLFHKLAAQRFKTDGFSYKVYSATLRLSYDDQLPGTTTFRHPDLREKAMIPNPGWGHFRRGRKSV